DIPTQLPNVASNILDPRATYADENEWQQKAEDLASLFVDNFEKFTDNEQGKALVQAGPRILVS
ncbi:MAG: phosphoenolpyruvate carboxykinase (ATP), partial [Glaciecola sp.]